jgi:DNA-binding PadR family transcriptional regulator
MSLKHAVLALVAERRGYGYELAQRFEARIGPGWQLSPSAVYPALEQLERSGLVVADVQVRGARQGPRVLYAATPAGNAALETWLHAPVDRPDPVRSELHLRLAFGQPDARPALAVQLTDRIRGCERLLARCAARLHHDEPPNAPARLIAAGVVARLEAELRWLHELRDVLAAERA